MRIAVWNDPPPGGARRAMQEFVRRLAAQHEVIVYQLAREDEVGELASSVRHVTVGAIRPRPHHRLAVYWNDWLTYLDMQEQERLEQAAAARIDAEGCDVVFVSVQRSCQAPAILRYLRTPSLYFLQEPPLRRFYEPWCRPTAAPISLYQRGRYLWRWPARAALDRGIFRNELARARAATKLLANSRYTAGRIAAVYGRDAWVNYYGIDAERFHPASTPALPRRVLSVGALEAHKGFDFVIRALGHLSVERRPALTILGLTGHPRMPFHLHQIADEVDVNLDIKYGVGREGNGSDDTLVSFYQSTAIFVFGAHYEPIPLVISEAMATGLPVVAVAEGGVPELVRSGETGLLVPRDELAFAQAVDRLLTDHELRWRMGRTARAMAENRTWDESARRLAGYLQETAHEGQLALASGRKV